MSILFFASAADLGGIKKIDFIRYIYKIRVGMAEDIHGGVLAEIDADIYAIMSTMYLSHALVELGLQFLEYDWHNERVRAAILARIRGLCRNHVAEFPGDKMKLIDDICDFIRITIEESLHQQVRDRLEAVSELFCGECYLLVFTTLGYD